MVSNLDTRGTCSWKEWDSRFHPDGEIRAKSPQGESLNRVVYERARKVPEPLRGSTAAGQEWKDMRDGQVIIGGDKGMSKRGYSRVNSLSINEGWLRLHFLLNTSILEGS